MTLPDVPPLPRCECGREVWNSLLIGAQCTVCLDTMRLNDALAELEKNRRLWVIDAAVLAVDTTVRSTGHGRLGTFRVPGDHHGLPAPASFGTVMLGSRRELDILVARIAQTIAECRADIEAGTW